VHINGASLVFFIFAFASGVLMAIQGTINGAAGKVIGTMEGNFLVHAVGLLVISILLFIIGLGNGSFSELKNMPWWCYLGGVINVGIIYGVMYAIPKIGVANATAAIIVGQVGMAMLIDVCGFFMMPKVPFSLWKLLGLALLTLGGRLVLGKM